MNDTALWIIAISTLVTAIAFLVLVAVAISVFYVMRRTGSVAQHIGEAIEKRVCPSCPYCKNSHCKCCKEKDETEMECSTSPAMDIFEILVSGVALWQKLKDKRRR